MAYIKNTWDKYTWAKGQQHFEDNLNHMESGIEGASQIEVVQTTGQDTTKVMSQKAVTDAINAAIVQAIEASY